MMKERETMTTKKFPKPIEFTEGCFRVVVTFDYCETGQQAFDAYVEVYRDGILVAGSSWEWLVGTAQFADVYCRAEWFSSFDEENIFNRLIAMGRTIGTIHI